MELNQKELIDFYRKAKRIIELINLEYKLDVKTFKKGNHLACCINILREASEKNPIARVYFYKFNTENAEITTFKLKYKNTRSLERRLYNIYIELANNLTSCSVMHKFNQEV